MDLATSDRVATRASWRALPFLPQLLIVMSVPLYLGYLIKNLLVPSAVFMVLYPWSIISFIAVPVLCLAETVVLARIGRPPKTTGQHRERRYHAVGLAVGLGAMLAVYLVRSYG